MIRDLVVGEIITYPEIVGNPTIPAPLRRGSRGADVTYVQRVLRERLDYSLSTGGRFDSTLEAAVKKFQKDSGLPVTGIVDDGTYAALRQRGAAYSEGSVANIKELVLSMEVSLSLDSVSQLKFDVSDHGLTLAKNNYWNIRRKVTFLGMEFEISSIEFGQGDAGEVVTIEARNRASQILKRDKKPSVYKGGNATSYAAMYARAVGLKFFGENSSEKANISQSSNDKSNESVWDVLKRLAGENQFSMFEIDGRLFFASMQFLLGKFALVNPTVVSGFISTPVRWFTDRPVPLPEITRPINPPTLRGNETNETVRYLQTVLKIRANQHQVTVTGTYDVTTQNAVKYLKQVAGLSPVDSTVDAVTWALIERLSNQDIKDLFFTLYPIEMPRLRKSDDDVNAATLSMQLVSDVGDKLRPGMTITITDIPEFENHYIVTEVRWNEGTPDAVAITARTLIEPQDAKLAEKLAKRIDLTGGGYATIAVEDAFNS